MFADPPSRVSPATAYVMLIGVQFLWSSSIILGRYVHADIPPIGLSFWRWTIAALILLPFAWSSLRVNLGLLARSWKIMAGLAFAMGFASTATLVAVNFTTAINANVVNAGQPATTALVAWILLRERLTTAQVVGVTAAVMGILVMVSRADWAMVMGLGINGGDLWMCISIIGYAVYATQLYRMPRDYGLAHGLFTIFALGGLMMFPFYMAESIFWRPVPGEMQTLWVIGFYGLFGSATATLMWNAAIPVVGVNRAAIFVNLMPVFGAVLAIFFLGESLFAYHFAGAVLVFLGILLVVRGHRRPGMH